MSKYFISSVNERARENAEIFVNECEQNYFKQLESIVKDVCNQKEKIKYIMVAGPSSSGKTTTTHYLCDLLEQNSINAHYVSLDDFFLDRALTPLLPDGRKDYESVNALNVKEMQECFYKLNTIGCAMFPEYNFFTGINEKNVRKIDLKDRDIVVVEGNHGFHPVVINSLGTTNFIRVFIHPEKEFINDNHEIVISSEQLRLIRRTIRDVGNRGYSPTDTFNIWDNVIDGEIKHIYPYKHLGDYYVDSVYAYEPMIYKGILHKMLDNTPDERSEKLLALIDSFDELPISIIPPKSLMWEFLKNLKI